MSSTTDFQRRVATWSRDIDGALDSHRALTGRAMLYILLAASLSFIFVGVASMFHITAAFVRVGWLPLLLGLVVLVFVIWGWRQGELPPPVVKALFLIVTGLEIFSTYHNGLAATLFLPAYLVLAHLMMGVVGALWLGAITCTLSQVALRAWHPEVPFELQVRELMVDGTILAALQMATRFWKDIVIRFSMIGQDMGSVIATQEAELQSALADREFARANDVVSGLPNATGFDHRAQALLSLMPADGRVWFITLRLTRFKESLTHLPSPDQQFFLSSIISLLREELGDDAIIARSDGTEFIAAVQVKESALEPGCAIIERMFDRIDQPINTGHFVAMARPRMGVALWPDDGSDVTTLTAHAYLAQQEAERRDLSRPLRYSQDLEQASVERLHLSAEIARGLSRGEFELFYQPIVSTDGTALHKAEALIRWHHPERGLVPPSLFIPLAEQGELIVQLTDWVLLEASRQVMAWRKTLHPAFQVSVNMPPACLMRCTSENSRVLAHLASLGVPRGAVVLEITEGAMLDVTPELLQAFSRLRELGFAIALDDFGVGYSSFGQLDKLQLDFLKIDKSFIVNLEHDSRKRAVCQAIISVAQHLGFKVVAEGIETPAQQDSLIDMGCDYLQGYLFSRPVPPRELVGLWPVLGESRQL